MARGRFLSKKISMDKDINQLDLKGALIWTWLIAHLDVEGRFFADPTVIKGQVLPRKQEITTDDVEAALKQLVDLGIIFMYEDKGDQYLFAPKFKDHQIGLRKDREAASDIPAPPKKDLAAFMVKHGIGEGNGQDGSRSTAGVTPEEIPVKLIKDKVNLIKGEDEEKLKRHAPKKLSTGDERVWINAQSDLIESQKTKGDKNIAAGLKLISAFDDVFICINTSQIIMDTVIQDIAEGMKKRLDQLTGQPTTLAVMNDRKIA